MGQQLHLINDYNKLYFNKHIKDIKNITYRFYHYRIEIDMLPDFDINQVYNIDNILIEYIPTCYDYNIKKYNHKFIIDYYTD